MRHLFFSHPDFEASENLEFNQAYINALEKGNSLVAGIYPEPDLVEKLALLRLPIKKNTLRLIGHHPRGLEEKNLYLSRVLSLVSIRTNAHHVELVTSCCDLRVGGDQTSLAQQVSYLLRHTLGERSPLVSGFKTCIKIDKSGAVQITHPHDPEAIKPPLSVGLLF